MQVPGWLIGGICIINAKMGLVYEPSRVAAIVPCLVQCLRLSREGTEARMRRTLCNIDGLRWMYPITPVAVIELIPQCMPLLTLLQPERH